MRSSIDGGVGLRVGGVLLCLVLQHGCGGSPPAGSSQSTEAAQAISSKDQLKERLEMIAQTGSGGSAFTGVRQSLLDLKKTDAALADGLLKDLAALEPLSDQAALKAGARKMADKLK